MGLLIFFLVLPLHFVSLELGNFLLVTHLLLLRLGRIAIRQLHDFDAVEFGRGESDHGLLFAKSISTFLLGTRVRDAHLGVLLHEATEGFISFHGCRGLSICLGFSLALLLLNQSTIYFGNSVHSDLICQGHVGLVTFVKQHFDRIDLIGPVQEDRSRHEHGGKARHQ